MLNLSATAGSRARGITGDDDGYEGVFDTALTKLAKGAARRLTETPQGGIISPALSPCALDRLERLLKEKFPTKKPLFSFGGKFPCVNLVRYADDFIITGRTTELLEGEIKPSSSSFCKNEAWNFLL